MAHGTPDYGVTNAASLAYQVNDLGELAARLGSPDTYDRRGDVIWWDDFECSLNKWIVVAVGAGSSAAISTAKARNGQNSCNLHTGAVDGSQAQIYHHNPPPQPSQVGFEFSLSDAVGALDWFGQIDYYDGATHWRAAVRYVLATGSIQYLQPTGAYFTLASGVSLYGSDILFHDVKLVVDLVGKTYARILIDNQNYGGFGGQMQNVGASVNRVLLLTINVDGSAAGGATDTYVDDVILTQNEP